MGTKPTCVRTFGSGTRVSACRVRTAAARSRATTPCAGTSRASTATRCPASTSRARCPTTRSNESHYTQHYINFRDRYNEEVATVSQGVLACPFYSILVRLNLFRSRPLIRDVMRVRMIEIISSGTRIVSFVNWHKGIKTRRCITPHLVWCHRHIFLP